MKKGKQVHFSIQSSAKPFKTMPSQMQKEVEMDPTKEGKSKRRKEVSYFLCHDNSFKNSARIASKGKS